MREQENGVKEDVLIHQRSFDAFQHPMEPLLRSLGLMTTFKKRVLFICSTGDVLTSEQAKLLKLFQRPLAQFQMKVKGHWNKISEQVRVFDIHDDENLVFIVFVCYFEPIHIKIFR